MMDRAAMECAIGHVGTWYWRGQKPGIRYERRQAPLWMEMNLQDGKCWCGRPKSEWDKRQRRFCTSDHGYWWHYFIHGYWDKFRMAIFARDGFACVRCGWESEGSMDDGLAADHILAISLGGDCYDESNLCTLCTRCHAKKTASDMAKLAQNRRYLGIVEKNHTLEPWT